MFSIQLCFDPTIIVISSDYLLDYFSSRSLFFKFLAFLELDAVFKESHEVALDSKASFADVRNAHIGFGDCDFTSQVWDIDRPEELIEVVVLLEFVVSNEVHLTVSLLVSKLQLLSSLIVIGALRGGFSASNSDELIVAIHFLGRQSTCQDNDYLHIPSSLFLQLISMVDTVSQVLYDKALIKSHMQVLKEYKNKNRIIAKRRF